MYEHVGNHENQCKSIISMKSYEHQYNLMKTQIQPIENHNHV